MTPLKRRVAAVSAPLLLALSLSACGGGASGAPDDASTDDFCKAYNEEPADANSDDTDKAEEAIHNYADNLKDVGTPKDLSGDEREGFEIFVDFLSKVDAGDFEKFADGSGKPEDFFKDDEIKKATAFNTKALQLCNPALGDLESQLPSQ